MKGFMMLFLLPFVALLAVTNAAENASTKAAPRAKEEAVQSEALQPGAIQSDAVQSEAGEGTYYTEVEITEEMKQYAVPAPEDFYPDDYESSEKQKKKNDGKYSNDFSDNTAGYCKLDTLAQIEELTLLFNSPVDLVDQFLQQKYYGGSYYMEANKSLQPFVQLVRSYLPSDLKDFFSDKEILSSIMVEVVLGEQTKLTQACVNSLSLILFESAGIFNSLMGVGEAFALPDKQDAHLLLVDNPYNLILGIIAANTDTWTMFRDLTLLSYELGNARLYFNRDYLRAVRSWQELSLTPVSIVAKFAAVKLANAEQLEEGFISSGVAPTIQANYDDALATCNLPTDMPSSMPSLGPISANEMLAVVSVVDVTSDSAANVAQSWTDFRQMFPDRFFCLLQIRGNDAEGLKIPAEFFADDKTEYIKVDADMNGAYGSNWFDLCSLYKYPGLGIKIQPLYVDTEEDVQASVNLFNKMASTRGIKVLQTTTNQQNWIVPFLKNFQLTS